MTINPRTRSNRGWSCSQLSCKCVIVANYKLHVFNEVPMRPGMLPMLQHPRRSHVTPDCQLLYARPRDYTREIEISESDFILFTAAGFLCICVFLVSGTYRPRSFGKLQSYQLCPPSYPHFVWKMGSTLSFSVMDSKRICHLHLWCVSVFHRRI